MPDELKILMLEDVPEDAELIKHSLRKGGITFSSLLVDTREGFVKGLEEFSPDIILSDYKLPTFDGLSALAIAKEKYPDIPFIMVSGSLGEERSVETIKSGVTDYVLKDHLVTLVPAVQRALAEAEQQAELRKAEERLKENEERFRSVAETANDAIIAMKAPGIIYFWNRKAEEMFGYTYTDAIGMDMHKLIVPERYREKAYEGMKNFFQTGTGPAIGKSLELVALRKDGSEMPVELSISAMNIRGEWHATGIIRDISERKRLEDELKEKLDVVERMNKLMVGRELKMEELRKRIKDLEAQIAGFKQQAAGGG